MYTNIINKHLPLAIDHPQQQFSMRRAAGIIFVMAMATTALLHTPVLGTTTTRRRSRFLQGTPMDSSSMISCNYEAPCPDIVDPVNPGFSFAGAECCDGVCVDTSFNANRCGGCDPRYYACGSWPWICCYGYCFNSQTDADNCGRCGNTCWGGRCFNGICGYAA